ncbi:MAG: glycogen synthase GlgA [Syntrophomonadaceae bacterium]|nr:glycogen synthase GlgA [Syntrophomonadaceae bacterium]
MVKINKVLILGAEVTPFAKTGGLADVLGSLPKALSELELDVRVAMPCHKQVSKSTYLTDMPVAMEGHWETAIIRATQLQPNSSKQVPVYLVDNYRYFHRESLYGYHDDAQRYDFFCKAVIAMLPLIGFNPDVIHCNDWQTGPLPLYLKERHEGEPFYKDMATLFTIHNLAYQGRFGREVLAGMGLGNEFFTPAKIESYGQVNFLKAGLVYADVINTVSKKYSMEIQDPEYGEGLDGLMRQRASDLYGILNGIDYQVFDPSTDPHIAANYNVKDISPKKENKKVLQEKMGLPRSEVPVIGLVTRLAAQKGLDLINEMACQLLHEDIQFVVLGKGEDHFQQMFLQLAKSCKNKVAVKIGFDPELAQLIYAGSDMFLMPSRYEPCGLGQMISLRYGTIPIVRATGGLEDTIIDYNQNNKQGTGFSFKEKTPAALFTAVQRALSLYRNNPSEWDKMAIRGMQTDFSWNKSAGEYLKAYERALIKRQDHYRMQTGQ